MRDADDTVPMSVDAVGRESDVAYVLVEITQGSPPLCEVHVFGRQDLAEVHAMLRYQQELEGHEKYLSADEVDYAWQRLLTALRRGRPINLSSVLTLRMRGLPVRR